MHGRLKSQGQTAAGLTGSQVLYNIDFFLA